MIKYFFTYVAESGDKKVDYIPGIPPTRLFDFPTIFEGTDRKTLNRAVELVALLSKVQYLLSTCTYELEPQVIDALNLELPFPVLTLRPKIPYFELESSQFHS